MVVGGGAGGADRRAGFGWVVGSALGVVALYRGGGGRGDPCVQCDRWVQRVGEHECGVDLGRGGVCGAAGRGLVGSDSGAGRHWGVTGVLVLELATRGDLFGGWRGLFDRFLGGGSGGAVGGA